MTDRDQLRRESDIILTVERWLDAFIVALNLCPFARRVRANDSLRFHVSRAETADALLGDLSRELGHLDGHPDVETTLVIHPQVLTGFEEYNQFLNAVDRLLESLDYVGVYQVASFHPDYQFADTLPGDAENYTNRSPYPMLHLLRESSVTRAVAQHPDADGIPATNIRTLNALGARFLGRLLQNLSDDTLP